MRGLARYSLLCTLTGISAVPQRGQRPARQSISPARQGQTTRDGSVILDRQTTIDGLELRYKISAVTAAISVNGQTNASDRALLGLHVLLHGDGGASFEEFPNKNLQGDVMGVVVLAPNDALLWGGQSTSAVQRPDGVAHATAVHKLIREELPKVVDFDRDNVWFSGVSGGSLLLSGFFMPMYLSSYKTGVMLMCGGMSPPVGRAGLVDTLDTGTMQSARIHWESSQRELSSLKATIPPAISYYEGVARSRAGMSDAQINARQTADATPTAGHCAFDNAGFNSGIQRVVDGWSDVMRAGGSGTIKGIGPVSVGAVGREQSLFR